MKSILDEGIFRYFQRVRNNEVCEARGSTCKETMDLFEKNLIKPNPIPKDLYQDVNYTNNLNWLIMSSEGTGKCGRLFCKYRDRIFLIKQFIKLNTYFSIVFDMIP